MHKARLLLLDTVLNTFAPLAEASQQAKTFFAEWTTLVELRKENEEYRKQVAEKAFWEAEAKRLSHENQQLQKHLHMKPQGIRLVSSEVPFHFSNTPDEDHFFILKHKNSDLKPGQAVLFAGQLVGRIVEVGTRFAKIMTLKASNSKVPVQLMPSNRQALLVGDGSSSPKLIRFSKRGTINKQETILTSGAGTLFPRGLAIGNISYDAQKGAHFISGLAHIEEIDMVHVVESF